MDVSNKHYSTVSVLPDSIDFNFHVKPILSDKCFKCHGPDVNTREADLAFHEEKLAFKALDEAGTRFANALFHHQA